METSAGSDFRPRTISSDTARLGPWGSSSPVSERAWIREPKCPLAPQLARSGRTTRPRVRIEVKLSEAPPVERQALVNQVASGQPVGPPGVDARQDALRERQVRVRVDQVLDALEREAAPAGGRVRHEPKGAASGEAAHRRVVLTEQALESLVSARLHWPLPRTMSGKGKEVTCRWARSNARRLVRPRRGRDHRGGRSPRPPGSAAGCAAAGTRGSVSRGRRRRSPSPRWRAAGPGRS